MGRPELVTPRSEFLSLLFGVKDTHSIYACVGWGANSLAANHDHIIHKVFVHLLFTLLLFAMNRSDY